jgi:anti-sigma B factor antagonist
MPESLIHSPSTACRVGDPPVRFACVVRDSGLDVAWLRVVGELDIATAPELKQALRRADVRSRRVVLDLRGLTFMDSSGAHVIVDASIRASAAGNRLVLVRGPSQVDRLLALSKLIDVLEIVDLQPAQPPVQALVELARKDRVAKRKRSRARAAIFAPGQA